MKKLRLFFASRSGLKTYVLAGACLPFFFFHPGCATKTPRPSMYMQSQVPVTVYGNMGGNAVRHNVWHVVGPSETLWRISKTYGVEMKTLMAANKIADPAQINKGQKILIPRTQGAKPLIPLYPNKRWTHIVIHHTATDAGNAFAIDQLHQRRGFWNGLGYHFLIDNGTGGTEDGQIEVGPRWIKQQVGAHANANGMNEHGIGISLVGNFSESYVTEKELQALIFLVKTLQSYYKIPRSNVIRHGEVPGKNTECPGTHFPWDRFKSAL